ncbi:hypothetical protein DFS33DRAFT_1363108 [Desarmillaria ectypa]|nr:hypothetical protein DFS33DRAFT_1363108 [Desarmillaria ectypa]
MAPSIYSLPLELINAIIDEIHNDSEMWAARCTLISCRLVSRVFVKRTREHLFQKITVWFYSDCKKFIARSQHIHTFTTSLTIVFQSRGGRNCVITDLTDVPSLIDVLHNVNTITLCGMRWESLSQRFIDSLASRSFLSITLMHTHFTDSNAFYSFLSHSPDLRQISCLMTTIDNKEHLPFGAAFATTRRSHITGLCLHKLNHISEMILSPTLSPLKLDKLYVLDVILVGDQFDRARRLLELTTQSLKVLQVSQFEAPPIDRSEYLPIQQLRSITIEIKDYHLGNTILSTPLVIFNWWIGHFQNYPAMQCSHVHFLVQVSTYTVNASADYTAWKKLDIALSRTSIRSLVVDLFINKTARKAISEYYYPLKLAIEENLPILMSRKIALVQAGLCNSDNMGRKFLLY